MFRDKEIDILHDSSYVDEGGLQVEGEIKVVKTIKASVQPYNKEMSYRDYSFSEDVKYRVFCKPEQLIKLGTPIAYQEQFKDEKTIFRIVKIAQWSRHWEVLLDD